MANPTLKVEIGFDLTDSPVAEFFRLADRDWETKRVVPVALFN